MLVGRAASMRVADLVMASLFLAFGALVMWDSRRLGSDWGADGPQAGYFPFYIGLILVISGAVTIYCDGKFSIDNSAKMQLNSGATLTVYADEFEFKNDSRFNATSPATPSRVTLYTLSNKEIKIDNSAQVSADVLGPSNTLTVKNDGRFFGRFQGDKLNIENSGRFTQDLSLTGAIGSSGGSGGGSVESYQLTWVEME